MDMSKQKNGIIKWNRKIHLYCGLCLLFFIWLFGLSGVLLNHHWKFANSWEKRKETSYNKEIQISDEREKYPLAQEIIDKLNLNGNIYKLRFANDSSFLNISLAKPGTHYDIQASLNDGIILIKSTELDKWDMMRTLHKLRNPTKKEQNERYFTFLSSLWSISIDVVSIGLIITCLGGWYMWLQITGRRFYIGLVSLAVGFILCVCFLLF
jgi:hypothetical protein